MILELLGTALLSLMAVQDPPPTVLDEVVVEGVRRTEETAFEFIEAVSAPPFGSRTLAVWTTPLCLSVENLPPDQTAALRDRILGRAEFVGAEIAEGGCAPNVMVIFTSDGARTSSALVRANSAAFRPTTGPTQLERASLRRFTDASRPVRWWTVNLPVDVETGQRVVALAGENIPVTHYQTTSVSEGSAPEGQTGGPPWRKLKPGMQPPGNNIRESLQMTMVVVDATLASGTSFASLGDYVAMIALAQVDPEASFAGQPTVLDLFSPTPGATELTRWDLDYLTALYDAPVAWTNIRFQKEDIARRMVDTGVERARE
ncbi:MAG: hypothetical protein ACK4JY_02815 [Brevundimonas sp.]|uniref:hypothetical protein n=1 Tax=Brevundimonas sp. TaxID=1871086 RepID=UPI00391DCC41